MSTDEDDRRVVTAEFENEGSTRSIRSRLGSDLRAARRGASAAATELKSRAQADVRAGRRAAAAAPGEVARRARNDVRAARRAAADSETRQGATRRLREGVASAASGLDAEPIADGREDPDGMFGAAEDATAAGAVVDATLDPTTSPEGLGGFASAGGDQADDLALFANDDRGGGLDGLAMIGGGGGGGGADQDVDGLGMIGGGGMADEPDPLLDFGGSSPADSDGPTVDGLIGLGGDEDDDGDGWLNLGGGF